MAPPSSDLRKIGLEGFDLIEKFYGPTRRSSMQDLAYGATKDSTIHFVGISNEQKIQVVTHPREFNHWMEVFTEQETYALHKGEPLKNDIQLKACDNELKLFFNMQQPYRSHQFTTYLGTNSISSLYMIFLVEVTSMISYMLQENQLCQMHGVEVSYTLTLITPQVNHYRTKYKLAVDDQYNNHICTFMFWDKYYVPIQGMIASKLRAIMREAGEDHLQIYPTYLDALLKKKLAFRVNYTTTFFQCSLVQLNTNEEVYKRINDYFKPNKTSNVPVVQTPNGATLQTVSMNQTSSVI